MRLPLCGYVKLILPGALSIIKSNMEVTNKNKNKYDLKTANTKGFLIFFFYENMWGRGVSCDFARSENSYFVFLTLVSS